MPIKVLPRSHVDHNVPAGTLQYALEHFAGEDKFFAKVLHLPDGFPGVPSALYGPLAGDEPVAEVDVYYIVRIGRRCSSRMVERGDRLVRTLVVIAGPAPGEDGLVLYTCYGGLVAPREPGDTSIGTWEEVLASREFWAQHALADRRL
jgi:hypothetical protein